MPQVFFLARQTARNPDPSFRKVEKGHIDQMLPALVIQLMIDLPYHFPRVNPLIIFF